MSILRALAISCVAVFCLIFFASPTSHSAAAGKHANGDAAYRLKAVVENILAGKSLADAKAALNSEAYLVADTSYVYLADALRSSVVDREKSRKIQMMSIRMEDDERSCFIVVRTERPDHGEPRYHTVLFVKSAANEWQIMHWHEGI